MLLLAGYLVTHVAMADLQHICKGPAYGCAYWRAHHRDRRVPCRIYMPRVGDSLPGRPAVTPESYREILAHEIVHCRYGSLGH